MADLGAWVWSEMKAKSYNMWDDNSQLTGEVQYAGRYFLDKLMAYRQNRPGLKVNLIGHSAGSIVICNLLKQSMEGIS